MIHLLDLALGITHSPTSRASSSESLASPLTPQPSAKGGLFPSTPASTPTLNPASVMSASTTPVVGGGADSKPINFIHEMRNYMPGAHRRFLYAVAESYSIRKFVDDQFGMNPTNPDVVELQQMFNRCVEGMKNFRDKHIQMVSVYIIIQARKRQEVGYKGTPEDVQKERINQVWHFLMRLFLAFGFMEYTYACFVLGRLCLREVPAEQVSCSTCLFPEDVYIW
jgi:hypothetical protein